MTSQFISPAPSRRTVVKAAAVTAVAAPALLGAASPALADSGAPAFLHGVASGDPLPDGVLLWTRVTPSAEAVPGSGLGPDVTVGWELAEDRGFARTVASGSTTASASSDHTVKADVRGLRPATAYWFRFTAGDAVSPAARTRTAPPADAATPGVRFGVVSCANWESGHFSAYRHLAGRADLDAVLHLGDYVYEYASGVYPEAKDTVRQHEPRHEIVSLADYRTRHGHYKTDADLQALHAAHPVVAIWDDHEFANDAWTGGAENHAPSAEGEWAARVAAAKQAYFEWMPVRASTEGTVFRRLRFGRLADLHLLDLRTFRSAPAKTGSGTVDDPERSITGRAQLDWLKAGLAGSDATWQLVGTSVMISPIAFGRPARRPPGAARRADGPADGGARGQRRPVGRLHRRPQGTDRTPDHAQLIRGTLVLTEADSAMAGPTTCRGTARSPLSAFGRRRVRQASGRPRGDPDERPNVDRGPRSEVGGGAPVTARFSSSSLPISWPRSATPTAPRRVSDRLADRLLGRSSRPGDPAARSRSAARLVPDQESARRPSGRA
ncbi:hypothetical protein SNARM312S_04063 [Streptomyces narbonensis]